MRFWDSSALVPLCVAQTWTDTARELMKEEAPAAVSWLALVECWAAFARLCREGVLTCEDEDRARLRIAEIVADVEMEVFLDDDLRELAGRLVRVHPLSAADTLQLASALTAVEYAPSDHDFVCFDKRLRQAAAAEGFRVLPAEPYLP